MAVKKKRNEKAKRNRSGRKMKEKERINKRTKINNFQSGEKENCQNSVDHNHLLLFFLHLPPSSVTHCSQAFAAEKANFKEETRKYKKNLLLRNQFVHQVHH